MSVDYDIRRQSEEAKVEDSLEEFELRAETSAVAVVDEAETLNEAEQNPWVLESNDELRVRMVPEQHDEFTCTSCFLVHHRSQLVDVSGGQVCSDCVGFEPSPGPALEPNAKDNGLPSYEDWTIVELGRLAAEWDISGRSSMNKSTLISALRHH